MLLFLFMSTFLVKTFALICPHEIPHEHWSPFSRYDVVYRECDDFFDVCCDGDCCPRFTQSHIWLIVSCLSFVLFLSIFGVWYCCCKRKMIERNVRPVRDREHVSSPLTQNRNMNSNHSQLTPPPSYGLTVAQGNYNPSAQSSTNHSIGLATAPPTFMTSTENRDSGATISATNQSGAEFVTPPPSYEEATAKR